jgi:hypothetical protein
LRPHASGSRQVRADAVTIDPREVPIRSWS